MTGPGPARRLVRTVLVRTVLVPTVVIAGMAVGVGGLLAGCARQASVVAPSTEPTAPSSTQTARGNGVLVLGDSLAEGARDHGGLVLRMVVAGHPVQVVARQGETTRWALEQAQQRRTVPPVVVVVMGTNPGPQLEGFAGEADALVRALVARGAERVLWVPPVARDLRRYAEHRRVLGVLEIRHRELEVAPWLLRLAANAEWFVRDGIHLSDEGYAALADTIVSEVAEG